MHNGNNCILWLKISNNYLFQLLFITPGEHLNLKPIVKREKMTGISCWFFLVQKIYNTGRIVQLFINLLTIYKYFDKWMRACVVKNSDQCDLEWHLQYFGYNGCLDNARTISYRVLTDVEKLLKCWKYLWCLTLLHFYVFWLFQMSPPMSI